MASNPASPDPSDLPTADFPLATVIAANAAALHATLSALVPLPPPNMIVPSRLVPGGVTMLWTTWGGTRGDKDRGDREARGEHEMVAHLDARSVARMAFDMGDAFEVAVDSDGPSDRAFPAARMGDLRRFKTFEPMSVEDEDRMYEDVERVAKSATGDGCPKGDGCCRSGGKAHQEHAEWPMSAPVYPVTSASSALHGQPIFPVPAAAPRLIATRDQLFAATLPHARSNVKAAIPIWLWPIIMPLIEKLLAAILKSLFSAKAEFAARGVGIAIEGEA